MCNVDLLVKMGALVIVLMGQFQSLDPLQGCFGAADHYDGRIHGLRCGEIYLQQSADLTISTSLERAPRMQCELCVYLLKYNSID